MRHAKVLATLLALLIPLCAWGQQSPDAAKPEAAKAELVGRLSYQSSQGEIRKICMAVSRDGEYRMIFLKDDLPVQRRHGTMDKDQLEQLTKLLDSSHFRALQGNRAGVIRQESESFAAEIPVANNAKLSREQPGIQAIGPNGMPLMLPGEMAQARRFQWLNPDGESPFPASVKKIVEWLEHFQPKDAKEFDYAEFPDVCPSIGVRLVQPTMAENRQ